MIPDSAESLGDLTQPDTISRLIRTRYTPEYDLIAEAFNAESFHCEDKNMVLEMLANLANRVQIAVQFTTPMNTLSNHAQL